MSLPIVIIRKQTDSTFGDFLGYRAKFSLSTEIEDMEDRSGLGECRKSIASALIAVAHLASGETLIEYNGKSVRSMFDAGMDAGRAERVAAALVA